MEEELVEKLKVSILFEEIAEVETLLKDVDFASEAEAGAEILDFALNCAAVDPAFINDELYEIIELLFRHGAKKEISDEEFEGLLDPDTRDFKLAAIFARHAIDINKAEILYWELFLYARLDVVKFLVESGADVNQKFGCAREAPIGLVLAQADACDTPEQAFTLAAYLMEKGADINDIGGDLQYIYEKLPRDYMRFALAGGIDFKYVQLLNYFNGIDLADAEKERECGDLEVEMFHYGYGDDEEESWEFEFKDWKRMNGKPFFHFFWYIPARYDGLTEESLAIRRMIYAFKDGLDQEDVRLMLKAKLMATFGSRLHHLTLVCIPASTKEASDARYESFAGALCSELGMQDGYRRISFVKEKTPQHLGGSDKAEFALDQDFFRGRQVVLFDDVVTRGRSMREFIRQLEGAGADVICQISIGKTYNDWYMKDEPAHPYTGREAFLEPGDHSGVPF